MIGHQIYPSREALLGKEPTKIDLARRAAEARRLVPKQAERITAGLPMRPRRNLKTLKPVCPTPGKDQNEPVTLLRAKRTA